MARYQKPIDLDKIQEVLESGGKLPPQSESLEETVLGSVVIDDQAANYVLEHASLEDFYFPNHRLIFETFKRLSENNSPIDLVTVEEDLDQRGKLKDVGGTGVLVQLTTAVTSASNVEYYHQILKQKAVLRKLILIATQITAKAYDVDPDVMTLLDYAEEKLFELTRGLAQKESALDPKSLLVKTFDKIVEMRDSDGIVGIPTGIEGLDEKTGGWKPGQLIVIGARPSMGKSGLAITLAKNAGTYDEHDKRAGCAIFSLEMPDTDMMMRLMAMTNNIDLAQINKGQIDQDDFAKLADWADRVKNDLGIVFDDSARTLLEIKSRTREYMKKFGVKMVMVDYLQLMDGQGDEGNREQEIARISRGLKQMAMEYQIPVIALSQLSRKCEERVNKIPILSDLRESGQIEQDADVIVFVYRPEVYGIKLDPLGAGTTEGIGYLLLSKQRNGPLGNIKTQFNKETTEFRNLAW